MKKILSIYLLILTISCTKENVNPTDSSNTLRCIDITPNAYSFMKGKWIICGATDNDPLPINLWTYNFIPLANGHDSIPFDTLITTQTSNNIIISCDTFVYQLARDYNIDIITGFRLKDHALYFDSWELRADNSFYLGNWKLCKQ